MYTKKLTIAALLLSTTLISFNSNANMVTVCDLDMNCEIVLVIDNGGYVPPRQHEVWDYNLRPVYPNNNYNPQYKIQPLSHPY